MRNNASRGTQGEREVEYKREKGLLHEKRGSAWLGSRRLKGISFMAGRNKYIE